MDSLKELAPLLSEGGRAAVYVGATWFAFKIISKAYVDATERYKETAGESKIKVEEIKKENEEIREENQRLEEKIEEMEDQLSRCRAESFMLDARVKTLEERLGIATFSPPAALPARVVPSDPGAVPTERG